MSIFLRKLIPIVGLGLSFGFPAFADEAWVAKHNLAPGDIVRADDVELKSLPQPSPEALPATRDLTGMEIKRRVYTGHPVGVRDIGTATIVKANAPVEVRWVAGALSLTLQGNALEPGSVGDRIRVLNPTTSRTIRGIITEDGAVEVRGEP